MIEQKLELLDKQRKELMNLDNFDNISVLWQLINENYNECKNELTNLNEVILNLFNETLDISDISLTFQESFNEMNLLIKEVEQESLSNMVEKIKRIQKLYQYCLFKLSQEQAEVAKIAV